MRIGHKEIGGTNPCFIIAELSANHGRDIEIAKRTVEAARKAGADAIKLQTYTPDTITLNCDNEHFRINQETLWDGKKLYDLYEEAYLPWEWHEELFNHARLNGLICFSSPFDHTAVDFLEALDAPAYKIASFEITDIPLIEYAASKGKPVIVSTGIADEEDIELAVSTCRSVGNNEIILLKCTSQYPARIEDANLLMIRDLAERFGTLSGLSDHTLGPLVPTLSIAMGAKVIEKHFILDKSIGGPDADFSLDEAEFSEMVNSVREAERALGIIDYSLSQKAKKSRHFSRSLFVTKDVKTGDVITEDNVRSVRPGVGLHPKYLKEVIGKSFLKDLSAGTPLDLSTIS